jgi:hypothetical protein
MRYIHEITYMGVENMGMAPYVRKELIEKADEIVKFARSVFSEKRSETLRKAAKMYKEATLSFMAEIIEKEADDWDIWSG